MTEQDQIQELIAEKRHEQVIDGNAAIVEKLGELISVSEKGNLEPIVKAMEVQNGLIEGFSEAIKSIPSPQVNVELNQDVLVSSISKIGLSIINGQQEIILGIGALIEQQSKLKEWDFKIEKEFGRITKVKAIQTK